MTWTMDANHIWTLPRPLKMVSKVNTLHDSPHIHTEADRNGIQALLWYSKSDDDNSAQSNERIPSNDEQDSQINEDEKRLEHNSDKYQDVTGEIDQAEGESAGDD